MLKSRRSQWFNGFSVVFVLSLVTQLVARPTPAPLTSAAPAAPAAQARRFMTDAEMLTTVPNTLEVSASGIQPSVLEVTANQMVTLLNSDTITRRLKLTDVPALNLGHKVYLPVVARSSTGLLYAPVAITLDQQVALTSVVTITLSAGQSVTRAFTTVGAVYVSDADHPAVAAATVLVTPLPLAQTGNVSGLVRDFKTKAVIAAAHITTVESPTLQTSSDAQGAYVFSLPPGDFTLVVFANGYTFANRKVSVAPYAPTGVEPLELVPLDPVVTAIGAAGGVVTNALNNTSVIFSGGAVSSTKAIRLTQLPVDPLTADFKALPGNFTDGSVPLGFVMFEPDGTQFSGPVTWTIAYSGSLPIGTYVPCYYWLESEARWGQPVPGYVIDLGSGNKGLQAVLPHFSSYGFSAPPPPQRQQPPVAPRPPALPDPADNPNCECNDTPNGSLINQMSGGLSEIVGTQGLPNTGGLPTQITARYRSLEMGQTGPVILSTTFGLQANSVVPDQTHWRFDIAGRTFTGTGYDVNVVWDGTDASGHHLAPGVYYGALTMQYWYQVTAGWSIFNSTVAWPLRVTRTDVSPFGVGWFSPHDALLIDTGQAATIVQGDGRRVVFARQGATYLTPTGDFGTLAHNGDGSWSRAYTNGSTLTFNADGRLTRISDRYGNAQVLLYESNGRSVPTGQWGLTTRLRRVTDTAGNTFDYAYDANGWLASLTDNAGRVYGFEHDAGGHLTAAIDPLGQRETFTYDSRGMLTSHTDRRGSTTNYVLDNRGRLLTRSWPTGAVLQMSYIPAQTTTLTDLGTQRVVSMDDKFNPTTVYNGVYTVTTTYNDQLLPYGSNQPPQATLYDANGRVIEVLAVTHQLIERAGPFDQVSRWTRSDGGDTHYTYDAAGNRTGVTDVLGQTYNLTYNTRGQPTSISDPLGQITTLQYSSRGQVTSLTNALSQTVQFTYDAGGRLINTTDPLNHTTAREYDALNRLTAVVDALSGRTTARYDANGNLTGLTDPTSRVISYTYDALNRQTGVMYPDGGQTTYGYDAVGNVISSTNALGQLSTRSYDAANHLTGKNAPGGAPINYAFDTFDQLTRLGDGVLTTTLSYLPGAVGKELHEQQLSAGLPLSATVNFDYSNGAVTYSSMGLTNTPAAATAYIAPLAPQTVTHNLAPAPSPDSLAVAAPRQAPFVAAPAPAGVGPRIAPRAPRRPAAEQAAAPTVSTGVGVSVSGQINANTTWTMANSPYTVFSDVTVADGVTLTIQAGVQVNFSQYTSLIVNGNLKAVGTATQPITFTAPVTTTGYWGYIQIGGGSVWTDSDQSRLSYVTIDHGGWYDGIYYQHSLYILYATPALDHLTIQHSGYTGLEITNSNGFINLDTATFSNNGGDGLDVANTPGLTLTNVIASNNGSRGIVLSGIAFSTRLQNVTVQNNLADGVGFWSLGGNMTITGITVTNNAGYGLWGDSASVTLDLRDSAITSNAVAAILPLNTTITNINWAGNTRNDISWAVGTLNSDSHWSILPGGVTTYHVMSQGSVTVRDGVTLTVDPGVTVLMDQNSSMSVPGNLRAIGTAAQPITFTGYAPIGYTAYWGNITIGGGSIVTESDRSQLSYVTIDRGGYYVQEALMILERKPALDHLTIQHSNSIGLYVLWSDLTVDSSTFSDNGSDGIHDNGSNTLTLTHSTLNHNGIDGMYVLGVSNGVWLQDVTSQNNLRDGVRFGGNITITNSTLSNNAGYGLEGGFGLPLLLQNSAITNNGVAARLPADTTMISNTWTGNTRNEIEWVGGISSDRTWQNTPDIQTYRVYGNVQVGDGVTLTIEPGVQVLFYQYSSLTAYGNLRASGTAANPITFTAPVTTTGYWYGIQIGGGSVLNDSDQSRLSYVTIDYGGYYYPSLYVYYATPTLDHLMIQHSGGDAIQVYSSDNLSVMNSRFSNNTGYGIRNWTPDKTVTGLFNYWDAPSGPYHPTLNPTGAGAPVSDGVLFTPWNLTFSPGVAGDGRVSGSTLTSNLNAPQSEHFGYDATGRLTSLSSSGYSTFTLAYTYDANSRLLARAPTQGHPMTSTFGYDAADRLTQAAISNSLGLVWQENYTYDADHNMTGVTSSRDGAITYTYDALNRLTGVSSSGFNASYGYDAAGNRTSAGGITWTYDGGGRLTGASNGTTYGYDAAGRLLGRTLAGQTTSYTWDARNHLVRIDYPNSTYSAYQYDALGRRISKRMPDGAVSYYVYIGSNLAQELDSSGAVIASYTYDGLDRPISLWRNGATYYYLLDQLGSVLGLTDAGGSVVATYRYDPWGNVISSTGTLINPLRFTAREYDAESGLYFYRARYYDPQAGRFISRDPSGIKGGLNLYAYVRNNPIDRRDPRGLGDINWKEVGMNVCAGLIAAVGIITGATPISDSDFPEPPRPTSERPASEAEPEPKPNPNEGEAESNPDDSSSFSLPDVDWTSIGVGIAIGSAIGIGILLAPEITIPALGAGLGASL